MNRAARIFVGGITVVVALVTAHNVASDPPKTEARVTKIIRDVSLMLSDAPPRSAAENEQVSGNTAVRTGEESRSELTFDDLSITRLGANTIFTFNKAGRSGQLGSGSILVYVPKDSGGGQFQTSAVTVGVTGTTFIFESTDLGGGNLIVLEGSARAGLIQHPGQSRNVRAGQMLNFNAGATKLPMPRDIDLNQIMMTHPLITDFPPLPSLDLIVAAFKGKQLPTSSGIPPSHGKPPITSGKPPKVGPTAPPPIPSGTSTFVPPTPMYTPRVVPYPHRPRPTQSPKNAYTPYPGPTATPPKDTSTPHPRPTGTPHATPRGNQFPGGKRPRHYPRHPKKTSSPTPTPTPPVIR